MHETFAVDMISCKPGLMRLFVQSVCVLIICLLVCPYADRAPQRTHYVFSSLRGGGDVGWRGWSCRTLLYMSRVGSNLMDLFVWCASYHEPTKDNSIYKPLAKGSA
jgi:hypothetical protein